MLLLAIDTATDVAGVAVADDSGVLATATVTRGRRHGESVAPAIQFVCRRTGVAVSELDAVAVDVGPGLFTGLRVGLSTAKGLGFALDIPLVAATSLEILAAAATRAVPVAALDVLVAVVDARRGQVFWAPFGAAGPLDRAGGEHLASPEELVAALADMALGGRRCLCLGDGAQRYGEMLQSVPGVEVAGPGTTHPDVAVLADIGLARLAEGRAQPAAAVTAHYLRDADVRINWERRRPAGVAGD